MFDKITVRLASIDREKRIEKMHLSTTKLNLIKLQWMRNRKMPTKEACTQTNCTKTQNQDIFPHHFTSTSLPDPLITYFTHFHLYLNLLSYYFPLFSSFLKILFYFVYFPENI